VFICLKPPPLLGFLSVKLLQNMVSNRTQHLPSSQPHSICTYILNFDTFTQGRGRGRVEPREKVKGQQFGKLGQKYQHD
jgi:hypothetical protein